MPELTGARATTTGPRLDPAPLAEAGAFLRTLGLVIDEISATRVTAHLDLDPDHHTPWGIVHGGVYTTVLPADPGVQGLARCARNTPRGYLAGRFS